MTKVIDGSNLVLGRLASYVARQALLGEKIAIVNCSNVYISGSKDNVKAKYVKRFNMGTPYVGPFQPKRPEMIVRRTVRGMVPYKQQRGKDALARVRCYSTIPVELKDSKMETVKGADISKFSTMNYISLQDISKRLGHKWGYINDRKTKGYTNFWKT